MILEHKRKRNIANRWMLFSLQRYLQKEKLVASWNALVKRLSLQELYVRNDLPKFFWTWNLGDLARKTHTKVVDKLIFWRYLRLIKKCKTNKIQLCKIKIQVRIKVRVLSNSSSTRQLQFCFSLDCIAAVISNLILTLILVCKVYWYCPAVPCDNRLIIVISYCSIFIYRYVNISYKPQVHTRQTL